MFKELCNNSAMRCKMKYCSKCNEANENNNKLCIKCSNNNFYVFLKNDINTIIELAKRIQ